jgi:hypothetical protein
MLEIDQEMVVNEQREQNERVTEIKERVENIKINRLQNK